MQDKFPVSVGGSKTKPAQAPVPARFAFPKRRRAGTLCLPKLRIHAKCFRRNELVKVLVISTGQLVPEVLICKPDLAGASPSFDDESIKVALTVIDYGHPTHFLKRLATLPERKIAIRIRRQHRDCADVARTKPFQKISIFLRQSKSGFLLKLCQFV